MVEVCRKKTAGKTVHNIVMFKKTNLKRSFNMDDGFELRVSDRKGEGIFATRSFKTGEIVMVGIIEKILEENHSHASQTGENEYVFHAGLISKVNHSCNPNCGIRINETGAHDFAAIREIIVNEEITFDYAMRDRKSTRLNSSHIPLSRMPSSA